MMRERLIFRGLTRRCPRCGELHIFAGFFAMKDTCPRCGLDLVREEGYYVGAMTVNVVVAEILTILLLATVTIWTWPNIPVNPLVFTGVGFNILFPLLFYPVTKTLWLAIDLGWFNQISPEEMQ